ncbi:hypothetical protein ACFLRI_01635 [Bacteroidota bacterium]
MKNGLFVLLALLLFTIHLYAQNNQLEIKAVTTGKCSGDVLMLNIKNNGNSDFYHRVYPFLLSQDKNTQALIFPFGQVLFVKSGEERTFFLRGYSVYPDRPPVIAGQKYDWEVIDNASSKEVEDFDSFFSDTTRYQIKHLKNTELMPFDFILTYPGSFEIFGVKFIPEENEDLTKTLLVEQARLLLKGYFRMYTAGLIITHFNNDPIFERDLFIQMGMWVCGSGIEGKALKRSHLKKILARAYEDISETGKKKEMLDHSRTYFNILVRIGKESSVFISPEELDRRPQCLPPVIGLIPISDNMKSPSFTKERFESIPVRNQVMLGRNDCISCKLQEELYPALRNYLGYFSLLDYYEQVNEMKEKLSGMLPASSDARDNFTSILARLEMLAGYSAALWLANNKERLSDRIKLAMSDYEQLTTSILKSNYITKNQVAELDLVFQQQTHLLGFILDNYQFRDTKYSFDCCELLNKPDLAEQQLAIEVDSLFQLASIRLEKNMKQLETELMKKDVQTSTETMLISTAAELYSWIAILKSFRVLNHNVQLICLDGPVPASRIEALDRIKKQFDLQFTKTGEFEQGKLVLDYSKEEYLEFHFGDCKCGRMKETHIPLIQQNEKRFSRMTNFSEKLPLHLVPRFEVSGGYGRFYFSNEGADKFDAIGLAAYSPIDPELDSILKLIYDKNYNLEQPTSFTFDYFSHYRLNIGYDILKNTQIRLGGTLLNGFAQGTLPLTYFTKPSDSTTQVVVNGAIRSKIQVKSINAGFRYYFGELLKGYTGLGAGFYNFKNIESKTYFDALELRSPLVNDQTAWSAFLEAGIRYFPNQDFFLEAGAQFQYRWDTDVFSNPIFGIDYSIHIGFGARF